MLRIGVDIGGTKTEFAVLDADGHERLRRRRPTPRASYEDALGDLEQALRAIESEMGEALAVGIGLPGVIDPGSGMVRNAYATPYNGMPLRHDLERSLQREIRIENDANCFALSEARDGAARGQRTVFGAILGTGTGGGIVVEGRALHGANGIAGEWGHVPLPWMLRDEFPGPRCYCGRHGCIERFVSGTALAADHRLATGEDVEAGEIAGRASAGDPGCTTSFARYEDRLARALALVVNLLDPDAIVLGGGISNVERIYRTVPRIWGRYVYSERVATPLLRAAHGAASGVRGAAMLWEP